MVPFIHGPQEIHGVPTVDAYLAGQRRYVAARRARGMRYAVHEEPAPVVAIVSHNTWLVQCVCGAGPATDPRWGIACCYGCGAIYRQIVWPAEWERAERVLLARPDPATRHWLPGETIDELLAENVAHGLGGEC